MVSLMKRLQPKMTLRMRLLPISAAILIWMHYGAALQQQLVEAASPADGEVSDDDGAVVMKAPPLMRNGSRINRSATAAAAGHDGGLMSMKPIRVDWPVMTAAVERQEEAGGAVYYVVEMEVGTPPTRLPFILDSFLSLTHLPCLAPGEHLDPRDQHLQDVLFKPDGSRSYRKQPCDDACKRIPETKGCVQEHDQCGFRMPQRFTVQAGKLEGLLGTETFRMGNNDHPLVSSGDGLLFGCVLENPPRQYSKAVFGLGYQDRLTAFARQLEDKNVFFCLPPANGGDGVLGFGDLYPIPQDIIRVPMRSRSVGAVSLRLTEITVDDLDLYVPPTVRGDADVELDMRDKWTRFPEGLFAAFVNLFGQAAALRGLAPNFVAGPLAASCWDLPADAADHPGDNNIPTITFKFGQDAPPLTLTNSQVLNPSLVPRVPGNPLHTFCVPVLPSSFPSSRASFLGTIQTEGTLVDIDNVARIVGFAPQYCA